MCKQFYKLKVKLFTPLVEYKWQRIVLHCYEFIIQSLIRVKVQVLITAFAYVHPHFVSLTY